MTLGAAAVRTALGLGDDARAWLDGLDTVGPPPDGVALPAPDDALELLRRLAVPDRDAAEIVDAMPGADTHPELWWLLARHHHKLVRDLGDCTTMDMPPHLPAALGPVARYFYVYVFLATVPAARRYHAERGVPDDVGWGTLDQLGELVDVHRRQFGVGGMDKQFWLTLHLRGVIYRLGRLQFNLQHLDDDVRYLAPGQPVLGTHIPELGGPLTPAACAASVERARPYFDRHFPEHGARYAVCTSWLLDPQLADHLPESSNIVQFLRSWTLVDEEPQDGDESVLEFVFRHNGQPLAELPRRTTLERAVLDHLDAGKHWHVRTGYLELP
ncbi:MAG: hypothetical protein GEV07_09095 [Streptosporangiales bacterium]|nr:hypothetical protein [Streptosporangiales bacterium]